MKPALVLYLALILVASAIFAAVYCLFQNVVETYPGTFSLILITTLLVGMYGITDNIVFDKAHPESQK
jgi:hypothetical protein